MLRHILRDRVAGVGTDFGIGQKGLWHIALTSIPTLGYCYGRRKEYLDGLVKREQHVDELPGP